MPDCRRTTNCGTYEINGVRQFATRYHRTFFQQLRENCEHLARDFGHGWVLPGTFTFSDAKSRRRRTPTKGEIFARYIREHDLGSVVEGDWTVNPNTDNLIKVFVWNVNRQAQELLN